MDLNFIARLIVLAMLCQPASAAKMVRFNASNPDALTNDLRTLLPAEEQRNTGSGLRLSTVVGEKVRYQQHFHGIPVRNTVITASQQGITFKKVSGQILQGIAQDLPSWQPTLSKQQALMQVKQSTWLARVNKVVNERAELQIAQDQHKKARLIYEVSYYVHARKPSRPFALIDAHSGEIIKQWDGLAFHRHNGSGPGGNEKAGRYEYGSDYGYLEVQRTDEICKFENSHVKTVNLHHKTSGSRAFVYRCPRNTVKEINGAYSPLNDAHYFGKVIVNMYQDWYNTMPLTFQLVMRLHYDSNYENAFWNGESMTFGDGGSTFYPLVSLDVSAHEVSHGFTEQHSNLDYYGQSGAINEAFSDMAGEAAEYYERGSNDWLVGAEIFKGPGALRYFADPTTDGRSIAHVEDYYEGLDVHLSSGLFNKAFYLLATTIHWDTKKAFDIFVKANQLYWTNNATFHSAAVDVVRAAADLGYEQEDVCAAFHVVGIRACDEQQPPPGERELQNGVAIRINGTADSEQHYYSDVPASANYLSVKIKGDQGDADLYVRVTEKPTTQLFDCRPYKNNSYETCFFNLRNNSQAQRYQIMVRGYNSFANLKLVATHDALDESLSEKVSGTENEELRFKFYSSGGRKQVKIYGGSGDADLYVKKSSQPSRNEYDCRPYSYGNNESCEVSGEGTYHIMVRGYSNFKNVNLKVTEMLVSLAERQQ